MALLKALRSRYPTSVRNVMLFGSKARGDSNPESDIDLLIVLEDYSWFLEKEITRLSTEMDDAYDVVLSDHVIDIKQFSKMAASRDPFYCKLEREGIDLWT